jgi:hypothetical protein
MGIAPDQHLVPHRIPDYDFGMRFWEEGEPRNARLARIVDIDK